MAAFASDCAFARDFRAVSDTFGEHKVHVGDADEAEEGGQVWGDQVGRSIFMDTAAAGNDDRAFTGSRPSGPFSV